MHGALTMFMPAASWTFLFNLMQYEWGGPQAFNVDHIWYSLILLGLPLGLGALVGAVVGHLNAKKLPS